MKKLYCLLLLAFAAAQNLLAQDPGDQLFGPDQVHEIRFNFLQTNYLDSLKNSYTTDTYIRCDVMIDGQAFPTAGVKYKGNSSYNNPSTKKPFRLDLGEFVDTQQFDGLKKLVLNNGFKDPTFLREKLMLDFCNAHGIPAPRATFTRLFVNNQYWGLYSLIEDVNKTFLKDRFDSKKGNLFKGDKHGTMVWKGPNQTSYAGDYELKTNELANDWSDLVHLLDKLNNTPLAALPDSLDRVANLDSWFSYWAAHILFVNLDSYVGSGHNYFVYHNLDTDKFEWITWDVNEAFGNFNQGISLTNLKVLPFTYISSPADQRPMMNRLLQIPDLKQRYATRLCELVQDFTNAKLDPRIDALAALIRTDVYADTKKTYTNQQFETNLSQDLTVGGPGGGGSLAGLKPFVKARQASLLQQLASYGCVPTGTAEGLESQLVEVFPNPTSGQVWVDAGAAFLKKIDLLSTTGQCLRTWHFDGSEHSGLAELSLADYSASLYFLKIETTAGCVVRKLGKAN